MTNQIIDNIGASTDLWISRVILIVEDVDSNYQFLNATLKRSGAEIIWVKKGEDAIDIIRSGKKIDIILMDIQLEGKDGYSITREIKELNPEIPIIAQTAFAMKGEKEKSIDAGCDEYLAKPIRPSDLIFTISKYL
ncbi:MAG: sensory transduction histidine [Bacteroidetes bacterium]|nr:MAG: sensory transduction histidine [Bacteroidota bacterium]